MTGNRLDGSTATIQIGRNSLIVVDDGRRTTNRGGYR